jgi:hypothetical protein
MRGFHIGEKNKKKATRKCYFKRKKQERTGEI